jgi:2-desacetyl-2-hydroxyethyl bacteriochlorophyllide A dehydrogenase
MTSVEEVGPVPTTMRAAVLAAPGRMEIVEKPVPACGPDEVLVKVAMCGTCGTDIVLQDVPLPGQPPYGNFTPGHEWTGTVVGIGSTVDEVAIGDRVAIHVHHGCGRCINCLTGSYTACLNYGRLDKGHRASGLTVDGGFAEYVVHNVSGIHKLPPSLSWEDGVLATTAGTAIYGLDRAGGLIAGDTVVVIGPGPVGLMALQAARALGAATTVLLGTRESRLALGKSLGADHVVNVSATDPVQAVHDLLGEAGADLVIETSGALTMPDASLRMIRRGGTVLFLAFYKDPTVLDLNLANLSELRLVTSRGEGRASVRRALALAESGLVRGRELVTHRYPLVDIQQGFDDLRERRDDPVKVVFVP